MNTYWRILGFAKPLSKYAIPYFFYTLFYALFNTMTFAMLIPVLGTLFDKEKAVQVVTQMPNFTFSSDFFNSTISYLLFRIFGETYDVMDVLLVLAITLVVISLFSNIFRYLGQWTIEKLRVFTLAKIRNELFDNVMNLNVGFFTNERKGDIIAKISSDVQVVQYCIINTLQVAFRDPFMIIAYIVLLLAISWQLTIFAVLFLPLTAFVIGTIVKRLRRSATQAQETFGDMVSALDESLSGVKVIKAYNATDYVKDKFHNINATFSTITRSMAQRQQLASPASEFLGISAAAVLLLFGGSLVIKGVLGGPEFIAYLGVFTQITRPLRSFTDSFSNINQGIAAGERILELMDTKSMLIDKPDAVDMDGFKDSIEFRDVRFSYGTREVIHGISFTVKRGETVALVGPSGGGKTTISDLIPYFYDINHGEILIDGINIRDYKAHSLRDHIGVVSQDTILFNDTIENNIKLGKRDATSEEVENAAKVANAHDFIIETDHGYGANIGDRGMKLSGGQRQRLSIARAVLKNPDILILDEATSALDTESEKLVQEALDSLLEGRTSIVIAHRLSTIYNADKIIVIEKGMIAEQGTHSELMNNCGIYSKLIEMQQLA